MLPWQPEFQSNQPKTLLQPCPNLMMLYIKFDQNWPTDLKIYCTLKLWTGDDDGSGTIIAILTLKAPRKKMHLKISSAEVDAANNCLTLLAN